MTLLHAVSAAVPLLTTEAVAVRKRRGAMIHAYVGPNGAGKSMFAALDTLPTLSGNLWRCDLPDHLHTQAGITSGVRTVLSTMRFTAADGTDHPLWDPLDDYSKIIRAEHCDLILDEVAGAAGSSTSDDLPTAVKASLQELRRRDVVCRWTAPSWARGSKVLRECSQAVTLVMGFLPVHLRGGVVFPGPHAFTDYQGGRLVDVVCDQGGEHEHDTGRQIGSNRLMYARTFDANVFDEWTTAKRQTVKPTVRQLFWRPGSAAEGAYDTFAYVEKLGQITDSGICVDCFGHRPRKRCECESPTVRRRRVTALRDATDVQDTGVPA